MLTVLLATLNGSKTLNLFFNGMKKQSYSGEYEIIIVDNGSSDNTKEIINQHLDELPIKYIFHPEKGKNKALNSGLRHTKGSLIIFTDDDIIPTPNWLESYANCTEKNPSYNIFSGHIKPHWEIDPPEWIFRLVSLDVNYAITDKNQASGPITPDKVWGGNMAIKKTFFDHGYRFIETVGPQPGQYMMGGETDFININTNVPLTNQDSFKCWFSDDSIVSHFIEKEQIDTNWLKQRSYHSGKGNFFQNYQKNIENNTPYSIRWAYKKLLKFYFKSIGYKLLGQFDNWFITSCRFKFYQGYIDAHKEIKNL